MDMTEEDLVQVEIIPKPEYKERIITRIRDVYSVDDEIAILRQRDTKPEEFEAYHAFVEQIKAEEREMSEA
jgi:cell fate regulator YaaT (PSP1 superfamily)